MSNPNWRGCWASASIDRGGVPLDLPGRNPFSRILVAALVLVIGAYQRLVSPLLGPTCRFHPSCSNYAIEALHRYGPFGGCARAMARLARCHPLSTGGYDPVR